MLPRSGDDDSDPFFVRRYVPGPVEPLEHPLQVPPEESLAEESPAQQPESPWAPGPAGPPPPDPSAPYQSIPWPSATPLEPPMAGPPETPGAGGGGSEPFWGWQAQADDSKAASGPGFPGPQLAQSPQSPHAPQGSHGSHDERPFERPDAHSPSVSETGGHRRLRARGARRRPHRRPPVRIVFTAGALAVLLVVSVGAWRLLGAESCDGRLGLNVAADPVVAPAVTVVARRFNDEHHKVGRRCVNVTATGVPSSGIAGALGGDVPPGQTRADAYIPDSSLWLSVAGRESERTGIKPPRPAGSVADSPVVFAMPKNAGSAKAKVGWKSLEPGKTGSPYSLRIVDPARDATGMAALLMARQTAGTGNDALRNFTGILQSIQAGGASAVSGDAETAFATFGHGNSPVPLVVTSEQAVWQHARGGGMAVRATIPADATTSLDYPFITIGTGDKTKAASEFLSALHAPAGAVEIHRVGLRTPDGVADPATTAATGLPRSVRVSAGADPAATIEALELWRRLRLGTRLLAMVDVSGSMLDQVAGMGQSRMQVTAQEVEKGMSLLPDDAETGLWSFSTNMDGARPYKELVPLAPMGRTEGETTHRATLQEAAAGLRAKPLGNTGLYDSVLAAFRKVKAGYEADKLNIVLVITDGRNDNKNGISRATLLEDLKREYDPQRPVNVVALGFGPGVDLAELQTIAKATDGAAYQIRHHEQIRQLFQRSAALKICDDPQRCPTG